MRPRTFPTVLAALLAASFSTASADGGHHAQPGPGTAYGGPLPHPAMHDTMVTYGFGHEFGHGPGHAGTGSGMHGGMGPGMHGAMGPGMRGAMGPGMHGAMGTGMHDASGPSMHGPMTPGIYGMNGAMVGLASLTGDAFDAAFMRGMIAHHEGAIAAADAILVTSEDPFVRDAAEAILATQQAEIDRMNTWLEAWFGGTSSAAMPTTMGSGPMDMGAPSATGAATTPDVVFLAEMIRHHQQAIDMAQLALERSARSAVLDLANDIIAAQSAEVRAFAEALRDGGAQ